MPIPLSCPCGRSLNVKDELAGRKIRCPACRAVLEVPEAEVVLDVLPADEPNERSQRRAAIQSERPAARPARLNREDEDDEVPAARRREADDGPKKRRPKLRRETARGPNVTFEPGWFGSINSGVVGGLLMIAIAVA